MTAPRGEEEGLEREPVEEVDDQGFSYYGGTDDERLAWPVWLVFAIGLLAGALVLGLAWATSTVVADDETPAARSPGVRAVDLPTVLGTEQSSASASSDDVAGGPSVADACARVVEIRGEALDAAEPTMDQWAVHIGAMNKLVVGAITLAQANTFWAQTRVAAKQKIHTFEVADDQARSLTVQCPPARLAGDATACARTAAHQAATLDAARTAVRTWKIHVHHMEMLRMGRISSSQAISMWLASWRKGADELRAYDAADRRVPAGRC